MHDFCFFIRKFIRQFENIFIFYDQKIIKYEDVLKLTGEFSDEKTEIMHGAFLLNQIFGKINLSVTNKLFVYFLLSDDDTLRKKFALLLMKIFTKIGGLLK